MRKKVFYFLFLTFIVSVAGCAIIHRPAPTPTSSGIELATKIEKAINKKAWKNTGMVSWHFAGAEHVWDMNRKLHRHTRGKHTVLYSLSQKKGIHLINGVEQSNPEKRIQKAYNAWINDSFWLNPLVKLQDSGVELGTLTYDGEKALLVHYTLGGNTPGDKFLWFLDENDRPVMWRMWVSVIPIGGVSNSWEGWTELSTGAWVATKHSLGPLTLDLSPVRAGTTWNDMFPKDPFASLLSKFPLIIEEKPPL
jgi:hypothetical protein